MAGLRTGFPQGNIERYAPLLDAQLPKIAQLLLKTIDPIICGALIELLGTSQRFRKRLGQIMPRQDPKAGQIFEIRLVYAVPDFVGFAGGSEPIKQDQQFILNKLQQVPGIKWEDTAVRILPTDGSVTVLFDLPSFGGVINNGR